MGVTIPVLHESLEEVIQLLSLLVSIQSELSSSQHDTIPTLGRLGHPSVERNDIGNLVKQLIVVISPKKVRLLPCRGIKAFSQVGFIDCAACLLGFHTIVTSVKETKCLGKANIGDGVEREKVGPGTEVEVDVFRIRKPGTLGKRSSADLIKVVDHLLHLIRNLVLPTLEILKGVGR
jgi:hypothetical protein